MRASKKFVSEVIRDYKKLFPAVRDVKFHVSFVSKLVDKATGGNLRGTFNTELSDWSPDFRSGIIVLSDTTNHTLDDVGICLVHELTHCYFKKVGKLHKLVEEALCEHGDTKIYAIIKHRLAQRLVFPS